VNGAPAVIFTISAIGADGTMIGTIAGNPFASSREPEAL
jgi:hypothetical protein